MVLFSPDKNANLIVSGQMATFNLVIYGPRFVSSSGFTVEPCPLLDHQQQGACGRRQSVEDYERDVYEPGLEIEYLLVMQLYLSARVAGMQFHYAPWNVVDAVVCHSNPGFSTKELIFSAVWRTDRGRLSVIHWELLYDKDLMQLCPILRSNPLLGPVHGGYKGLVHLLQTRTTLKDHFQLQYFPCWGLRCFDVNP